LRARPNQLEAFASLNGSKHYSLPPNKDKIVLESRRGRRWRRSRCPARTSRPWPIVPARPSNGRWWVDPPVVNRHPEVRAKGAPRRTHGPGRRPSRLATLAPQGDGTMLSSEVG